MTTTDTLITRTLEGDLGAAPRLLSLLEKGHPSADRIMERMTPRGGHAHRIGLTGPPGAGKSTLAEAITSEYRQRGLTVGVLVVDPSSPFTGGAILGDRVRMRDHFLDPGVFIRSMATRGASGGLSVVAPRAMRVLDAAGVDVIIVETAGVGQTELDIMHTVDSVVVVVVPEAGDAIQTMKAGLLEIADMYVVNKSDRPGARRMANDLEMTVHLGSHDEAWWTAPVLLTEGIRNIGIGELVETLMRHRETLVETGQLTIRREAQRKGEFYGAVRERLLRQVNGLGEGGGQVGTLMRRVASGDVDPYSAADMLLADSALLADLLRAAPDQAASRDD